MNTLRIPAQKEELSTSLRQLKKALESVSEDYRESLFIIFQELMINSIFEMDFLGFEKACISIHWLEEEDRIEGSVDDLGRGMVLCENSPETILSNMENETGRGLAIVQMLTDALEVIPLKDSGFKYKFIINKK